MKVSLNRINNNYLFEAKGASGVPVFIDNKTDEPSKGASPMELLLMGVGGCSAIDVVSILKKQRQEITSYKMEVEGQRKEVRDAKPFEAIHVTLYLEGKIDEAKAVRAAQLSFEKYCSVSITLEASVKITYRIVLNEKEIK
jgi:putative redox protein